MSHGGKGDVPRPFNISQEEYQQRHEAIFGKKPPRVPYVYVPPEKNSNEDPGNLPKDSEQGG
jgi:hypothetical protein